MDAEITAASFSFCSCCAAAATVADAKVYLISTHDTVCQKGGDFSRPPPFLVYHPLKIEGESNYDELSHFAFSESATDEFSYLLCLVCS